MYQFLKENCNASINADVSTFPGKYGNAQWGGANAIEELAYACSVGRDKSEIQVNPIAVVWACSCCSCFCREPDIISAAKVLGDD